MSVHQQPHRVLENRFVGLVGLLDGLGLCLADADKVALVDGGGNTVNIKHGHADGLHDDGGALDNVTGFERSRVVEGNLLLSVLEVGRDCPSTGGGGTVVGSGSWFITGVGPGTTTWTQ